MKKNVKSVSIAMLLLLFICASSMLGMQAMGIDLTPKTAYAVANGTDLVQGDRDMRVLGNYKPSSTELIGFKDDRSGVLLETNTVGSVATFKNEMTGDFYLDYRMLSYQNMRDINQIAFVFTDVATKRSFEVRLICQNNAGWYNTKVFVDGQTTGYGVRSDNGEASAVSSQGTYGQASFSSRETSATNTGQTADQPIGTAHTTGRVGNQILFNPNTMEVRVNSTGSRNSLKLVMDLDSEEHMEKVAPVMESFQKYTVKIKIAEFLRAADDSTSVENGAAGSAKRPGKVLLYSLNGQSLGGETLNDTVGPVLNLPRGKGVVGEPYSIAGITGYDVADGIIGYNADTFEVYDKDNNKLALVGGKFTPTTAGKYTIVCKDSKGNSSVQNFTYGNFETSFYAMRTEEIVIAGQPLRKYSNKAFVTIVDERTPVQFAGYESLNKVIANYPQSKLPVGKTIELPIVTAKDEMVTSVDEHGYAVGKSACAVGIEVKKGDQLIHIGMDEAFFLGLGKYLKKHGYTDRMQLMLRHLNRVTEIAERYGFTCQMWSDMFYHLVTGEHYADVEISSGVKKLIPEGLQLIYWNYLSEDTNRCDQIIKSHLKMTDNVAYAGTVWKFIGFAPDNGFSIKICRPAMDACFKNGIKSFIVTLWADNGAEASLFSTLAGLYYYGEYANGKIDEGGSVDKAKFKRITGIDFDDFLLLDLPNKPDLERQYTWVNNKCFTFLYNDILMGTFDNLISDGIGEDYGKCAEALSRVSKNEFSYLFRTLSLLCEVLQVKAELSMRIRRAYKNGQLCELEKIAKHDIACYIDSLNKFFAAFEYQWLRDNKSFGFETQCARIGALIKRAEFAADILNRYVSKQIDGIDVLDEQQMPLGFDREASEDTYVLMTWSKIVSNGFI